MITPSTSRSERLGLPPQHDDRMPHLPTCHQCTTDYYLKFMVIVPHTTLDQTTKQRSTTATTSWRNTGIRQAGKTVNRLVRLVKKLRPHTQQQSGGRVEYFCQKCGSLHQHEFPAGWEPTPRELTMNDLQHLPDFYVDPGERRSAAEITDHLFRGYPQKFTSA